MLPRGLLQDYATTITFISRLSDVSCVITGALIAYWVRFGDVELTNYYYYLAIIVASLFTFVIFSISGIYVSWRGRSWLQQARTVTLSWFVVVVVLIIVAFLTKTSTIYSRQWMAMWSATGLVCLLGFRFSFYKLLQYMRKKGWNHKRIVIVGTGKLGQGVARNIRQATWTGLDVVAFFDDVFYDNSAAERNSIDGVEVKSLANLTDFVAPRNKIDQVWLALPLREEDKMNQILHELRYSTVDIRFVPGIFGFRLLNHAITEVAGLPVIDLSASPMVGINRLIKGFEDRVLALLILIVVSPLLALIALGVKLSSPGPALFKQIRLGWDGKPIKVYKFRTMVMHQEDSGVVTQACRGDNRITRFGAFLRRSSLDELPQFWNVLQGRMSIVGPRPHAMPHNEQYKDRIDDYMRRHKVKPGITGWAQVHGWRGETDTLEKMQRRIEFDLYYIENWSLWLDIKIIFLTFFSGFVHKNAY